MKTTKLIHELEDRRDSFLRLQEEGEQGCSAVSDQTHACNFKVRIVLKRHLSKVSTIRQ